MIKRTLRSSRARRGGFDFRKELGDYQPPSFPALVTQALDMLADPEVDMADVSRTLEMDPGITARLLKFVNSSAVAPRSRITSVKQAAMLLGRNQLETVLISAGARVAIPQATGPNYDHARFWSTAAKRATLASSIAGAIDPTRRSENFTAALLQDMAIPVLTERAKPYSTLLEQWHSGGEELTDLEMNTFGWHHGDVASWMGTTWGFPEPLVDFLANHHDVEHDHLLAAHLVAPIREADDSGDEAVVETAAAEVGLSTDDVVQMIADAELKASELAQVVA